MPKKTRLQTTRELQQIQAKEFVDEYLYRIDLDADYQREKIWSREDQLKLVDSIYQNIDIPKLYLARVTGSATFEFECIDGKQRMVTLLNFFKPEKSGDKPLTVTVAGERYTYEELREDFVQLAERMERYELSFVIYPELDDENFVREIFRRLQLGRVLNSGELLKSHMGSMRDFIYEEMGPAPPFLKNTKLSPKRFSRQFTLAQICINSFSRNETRAFVRARYEDLEDFFDEQRDLPSSDKGFVRVRKVLKVMDDDFGEKAIKISSRAIAVSAYLFVETLIVEEKRRLVPEFVEFFLDLLDEIQRNLKLLNRYNQPENQYILEEFQKYISQASVETYAIKRRQLFLEKAFQYYRDSRTRRRIIAKK